MSNKEFVAFCFRSILGRNPDEGGEASYIKSLDTRTSTREDVLLHFVLSDEFKQRTRNLEFFPPGHYHSAIPSTEERDAYSASSLTRDEIPGVQLDSQKQFELLNKFLTYYAECPFRDTRTFPLRYYFLNESYSYTDALTLYSMIREFKPERIIEIGSGYSSCVMLDTSELFLNNDITFTFIEPHPELLQSLMKPSDKRHVVLPVGLQAVDLGIFRSLEANDILFVDSTHVSKLGSDVNRILFDILPSLHKGVLIHFHDIFWPFDYPTDWVKRGIAWNEAYVLRAFLEYNDTFEVLFFSAYLHKKFSSWFRDNMPLYLKNAGGNIWLIKQK
jgi:predicted O-methyltransferase YrrM